MSNCGGIRDLTLSDCQPGNNTTVTYTMKDWKLYKGKDYIGEVIEANSSMDGVSTFLKVETPMKDIREITVYKLS